MRSPDPCPFTQPVAYSARSRLCAALLLLCFAGLLGVPQTGCLQDNYVCGTKISSCSLHQADCEASSTCEWRLGCSFPCPQGLSRDECIQRTGCFWTDTGFCNGDACRRPGTIETIDTEADCSAMAGCNWQPSCWGKPNTECDTRLLEAECRARNCTWVLSGPAL